MPTLLLDRVVAPFDRTRRATLAVALKSPAIAFVLRDRARRIEARAVLAVLFAIVLSVVAPAFMLAIGPIVFGVPHVASEVRYLVVRRGLPTRWLAALVAGCAIVSGLRLVEQAVGASSTCATAEIAVAVAGVLAAAFAGTRGASQNAWWRFAALMVPGAVLALFALEHALYTRLFFVHVHNFGAIALWIFVFRKRSGAPLLALALIVGGVVLLASGATVPLSAAVGGLDAAGVDIARVGGWLVPGAAASVAIPLTLVHAFSDSVHYATWLSIIPEEELRAQGSLTFKMTVRSLVADFGRRGLFIAALATALVAGLATLDLAATRRVYFAVAGFHGYLEVATIAYLVVRGRARA